MTANEDGTFTSSRNVSLRTLPGWSGQVDCLVNRGMAGERRERVYFSFSLEENTIEEGMCETAATRAVCPLYFPIDSGTGEVEAWMYRQDWTLQCQCNGETTLF